MPFRACSRNWRVGMLWAFSAIEASFKRLRSIAMAITIRKSFEIIPPSAKQSKCLCHKSGRTCKHLHDGMLCLGAGGSGKACTHHSCVLQEYWTLPSSPNHLSYCESKASNGSGFYPRATSQSRAGLLIFLVGFLHLPAQIIVGFCCACGRSGLKRRSTW